jgi:hypothetical protein
MKEIEDFKIRVSSFKQECHDDGILFKQYTNAINFNAGCKDFDAELMASKKVYPHPNGNFAKQLEFHYLRLEVIPSSTKAKDLFYSFSPTKIEPHQAVALDGTAYIEKNLFV